MNPGIQQNSRLENSLKVTGKNPSFSKLNVVAVLYHLIHALSTCTKPPCVGDNADCGRSLPSAVGIGATGRAAEQFNTTLGFSWAAKVTLTLQAVFRKTMSPHTYHGVCSQIQTSRLHIFLPQGFRQVGLNRTSVSSAASATHLGQIFNKKHIKAVQEGS